MKLTLDQKKIISQYLQERLAELQAKKKNAMISSAKRINDSAEALGGEIGVFLASEQSRIGINEVYDGLIKEHEFLIEQLQPETITVDNKKGEET